MESPVEPSKGGKKPLNGNHIPLILDRLTSVLGDPRYIPRFDPMEELISCILSQHTSDSNSFPAFTRMRAHYPTWQDVVDGGQPALAEVIQGAGLSNNKSKMILGCLTEIKRRYGDYNIDHIRNLPVKKARAELESLPGVGPKTSSIVLCFAFGADAHPVDTHVYRVGTRLGLISKKLNEIKAHDRLLRIVPKGQAFRFHATIIQHGRMICRAQSPSCDRCPLSDLCPSAGNTKRVVAKGLK